ncbi:MAG: translation elongation factor EF-1 subunit alpha [Candidatus Altiarchaeota archaeon]|nr:translation elongation factor EF-1 subunit alpha [Candidatus Altiarchaeota archaeon]
MAKKPHLNVVFIGHVDHGKSTTIGRLLFDTGFVPENVMRKLKEEAKEAGKATFEFAFVMDRLKEERERGLTIDLAHHEFETDKYHVTIIDAPGHKDFIKNMITGTSQSDGAVLMVSAKDGIQEQTKEHITLSKTLGIDQIIIAINKMDDVNWSEDKYNEMKEEISKQLKLVGYKPEEIPFIPVSGYHGDNVAKKSDNLPWWKGKTLAQAINDTFIPPSVETLSKLPLRMPLQDVYTITGIGAVPVGRVETGIIKPGDKIVFEPAGVAGEVKTVEMHHQQLPQAGPGDNIGFNVRGLGKGDVRRGDVVGHESNKPTVAKSFTAQIVVMNHPSVIAVGYAPVFHAHTAQVACRLTKILKKIDPKTGQVTAENPDFIKAGDAAIVEVEPTKPMVIENYKEIPPLGRFAIRDMGSTVAVGMVMSVVKKKD